MFETFLESFGHYSADPLRISFAHKIAEANLYQAIEQRDLLEKDS